MAKAIVLFVYRNEEHMVSERGVHEVDWSREGVNKWLAGSDTSEEGLAVYNEASWIVTEQVIQVQDTDECFVFIKQS